jgi:LmbE family N-acetylglucosaminyl deacetylase
LNTLASVLLKRMSRAARPFLRSHGLLQVSGVYNRTAVVWRPGAERVVVLAPHMDDETIGCGGALALHAQNGAEITVVFLTDGRLGARDIGALWGEERERAQRELIETRKREARAALDILGVRHTVCLDAEDGALAGSKSAAAQLRVVLLERRPELVYLPFWLEAHADHHAASRVLLDAAEGLALEFRCLGYEVWTPLFPNCLVDVTAVMPLKRAALAQYASQNAQGDYLHTALGLNANRAAGLLDPRGAYAEAFCVMSSQQYRQEFERFGGR